MTSLIESLRDRVVGTVEDVAADRILVLLEPDAPQATALSTGVPAAFPRIRGYVLIPNEAGATVGVVSSVRVERLPFPKRRGTQKDFGLVDLPFPSRMMILTPVGTLKVRDSEGQRFFGVSRGVDVFPSVGDPVLLPDADQLHAIVEGEDHRTVGRVLLGHCPTAARAPVYVDPDKLFGRHLAVLGNTGAGKSCSVAGMVRWSLDAAKEDRKRRSLSPQPNARFIVLDPNGEYAKAFADLGVRVFSVEPRGDEVEPLKVPAWLWNGEEWAAFTGAAPGAQRPVLFQALRRLRGGSDTPDTFDSRVAAVLHPNRNILRVIHSGRDYLRFPGYKDATIALDSISQELKKLAARAKEDQHEHADTLNVAAEACMDAAAAGHDGTRYRPIEADLFAKAIKSIEAAASAFGVADVQEADEDVPLPFDAKQLPRYVEALAGLNPGRDLSQFVDTLGLRIRALITRERLSSVLQLDGASSLGDWLSSYIGDNAADNGPIAVIDLSLVPSEVIHVVVCVLARIVFEAVQRYRRQEGHELPTTLILEEAHTFVHRDFSSEPAAPATKACARVFERIAREGRKFGLGLVLASQRPSEISPTVLSQCNTFLLHRIVNDRDQDLVRKLVPDGLGSLLCDLPSLPSRRAFLLGWAVPAPVLVEVREVPADHRPHSPDPAFWAVWTGRQDRQVDWEEIARAWQGTSACREGLELSAHEGDPARSPDADGIATFVDASGARETNWGPGGER